ncbi:MULTISPECIES: hypothetical protein [unclassified Actinomyces]|uniref:hypothetical protein n=1 Tax=unclassified Actinomyces TaxID=2609248 RepID=UPI0013A6B291|nr:MULTISPECIES: hypothetical protein [unclassified Actinomyces]MBW3070010.1 hypothetical protein [Actinomyces sp. 594]NDR54340.1 hypothetical protein [Actinomyces sp. 565]
MAIKQNSKRNIGRMASLLLAGSLAVTLAACGSSDSSARSSDAAADAVVTETVEAAEETEPLAAETEDVGEEADTDAPDSAQADAGADADSAGAATPAPEGAMISAMYNRDLPEEVGDFTHTGSLGDAEEYKLDEDAGAFNAIGVEFIVGMDYAGAIENLNDTVPGGTGLCGTSSGSDHPLCYLQTADGALVVTAYSTFITVDEAAAFCNELTAQLGTE